MFRKSIQKRRGFILKAVIAGLAVILTAFVAVGQSSLFANGSPSDPFPGINRNSRFAVYYGTDYDVSHMQKLKQLDVLVVDPNTDQLTPRKVDELQEAGVTVLSYISIGEDKVDADASTANPASPMVLDGTGPVHMDRWDGQIKKQCGAPMASFYVDQQWVAVSGHPEGGYHGQDCYPDRNGEFGGYFVYPNADWRNMIKNQRRHGLFDNGTSVSPEFAQRDLVGLDQIATVRNPYDLDDEHGNYGFDGFFLDTLDTAGPWNNYGYYPWTAPAMQETVKFIRDTYPDKLIIANRGIFFYNPTQTNPIYNISPYDYTLGQYINGVLFESFYLDSEPSHRGASPYFVSGENVTNANYLDIESKRPNGAGFTVFGLDYKVDRGDTYYSNALYYSAVQRGWTEYLAPTRSLGADGAYQIDSYVMDALNWVGAYPSSHPVQSGAIQVVGGSQFSISDWDTVPYALFDGSDVAGSGNQIDWQGIKMAHDADNLYILMENESAIDFTYGVQMFIDTDMNRDTGYIGGYGEFSIGADILVQASPSGLQLYDFNSSASQTVWGSNWQQREWGPGYTWRDGNLEMYIPRSWIWYNNDIRLFVDGDNTSLGQANIHDFMPNDANLRGQSNINPYIAYRFD